MESSVDAFGANSTASVLIGGKNFTVFIDSWNNPIGFRRYGTNTVHGGNQQPAGNTLTSFPNSYIGELSSPPFVRSGATYLDPLDPEGKLRENWAQGSGGPNVAVRIFQALQPDFYANKTGQNANLFNRYGFPNLNMGPIIFSAGPDKLYHSDDNTDLGTSRSIANDDIISYRLRRTGQRGD
jgi:hypothetical protein